MRGSAIEAAMSIRCCWRFSPEITQSHQCHPRDVGGVLSTFNFTGTYENILEEEVHDSICVMLHQLTGLR